VICYPKPVAWVTSIVLLLAGLTLIANACAPVGPAPPRPGEPPQIATPINGEVNLRRYRFESDHVTCYAFFNDHAISCLRDAV